MIAEYAISYATGLPQAEVHNRLVHLPQGDFSTDAPCKATLVGAFNTQNGKHLPIQAIGDCWVIAVLNLSREISQARQKGCLFVAQAPAAPEAV